MRYLPDAKQMKTADSFTINELKIPSLELMERAARACVDHIKDWKINLNKICVLCGSGNNGGDGFAIARMFAWEGCDVTAVLVGNRDHCTPETAHQIEQLKNTGAQFKEQFEQEAFESEPYTLIIDAIFGVGLCREVGGRYAQIIECVNQSDAVRMSVDIPSGICATTGNVLGTVQTILCQFRRRKLVLYLIREEVMQESVYPRISELYHFHWKEMRKQFVHWRAVIMQHFFRNEMQTPIKELTESFL